jgi:L-lactate dehydrogenase complex protein LldG
MSAARDQILRRIRTALRDIPAGEQPQDVPVARDYHRSLSATPEALIELFIERVDDYRASIRRVSEELLVDALSDACAARGVRQLIVPSGLPATWTPRGVELLRDDELDLPSLAACDGVLTGCTLGIAQTGTIVLSHGPTEGRRAISLVPDYHLCVVHVDQIVGNMPEAIARLGDSAASGQPLTFISGPSATSDIELQRVEGVHGPRTLEVLVVDRALVGATSPPRQREGFPAT